MMSENCLVCRQVTKSYGKKEVLKGVDLTIEPGHIYGLIGRNGVGKTTLLSILTGQNRAGAGEITYNGQPVWENETALSALCFSRELSPTILFGQNTLKAKEYLKSASCFYPNWDASYADFLIKEFGIDKNKKICKMNKGMMSLVTITIALASGAPITILDEPVAGLDVYMRDRFYALLLEEYARSNRTFILSTHIIEEAANVLEEIIILNDGVVRLKENTQDLIDSCLYVNGLDEVVDRAVSGYERLNTEQMGRNKMVCIRLKPGQSFPTEQYRGELTVSAVPLQKIFVYLTRQAGEENGYASFNDHA